MIMVKTMLLVLFLKGLVSWCSNAIRQGQDLKLPDLERKTTQPWIHGSELCGRKKVSSYRLPLTRPPKFRTHYYCNVFDADDGAMYIQLKNWHQQRRKTLQSCSGKGSTFAVQGCRMWKRMKMTKMIMRWGCMNFLPDSTHLYCYEKGNIFLLRNLGGEDM